MSAAISFRDPAGFCIGLNGHILRVVGPEHVAALEAFLNSTCGREFTADGTLIPTRLLGKAELSRWLDCSEFKEALADRPVGAVFEHERIDFPSFPHEWSADMLHAAAVLTLDLALEALKGGYQLKDATPCNILFRRAEPAFVDVLSFEPRTPGQTIWTAYAQFVRTFLLPLLANKYWNTSLAEIFTTRRDGLEPEELFAKCTWFQKLRPPFLTLITLPKLLGGNGATVGPTSKTGDEKALFIIESLLKRLRSSLVKLRTTRRSAGWLRYMDTHNYDPAAFSAKETFVRAALTEFKPQKLLDVGANTGHFSRLAAGLGAQVIAIDSDAACAGECFARARQERLNVLPLVVDIARPTPSLGWRNAECASFLDRARGHFDAVLMLALVHHLLVSERVALNEIIDLAAELTKSLLIIEFVPFDDPMFQRLLRGRDALFAYYNRELFERTCERRFDLMRSADLPGTSRRLYLLRKK